MIVFHGTTVKNASRIQLEGFRPRGNAARVWFTQTRSIARRRAAHKSRGRKERPIVLTCDLNLEALRRKLGARKVLHHRTLVTVEGKVPPAVILNNKAVLDTLVPRDDADLARWLNRLLGLQQHKGIGKTHPGVNRLRRWLDHRVGTYPESQLKKEEVLEAAKQWLPEYFKDNVPVFDRVRRPGKGTPVDPFDEGEETPEDDQETARAYEVFMSEKPNRRARGLAMLEKLGTPDLQEWCLMMLEDEAAPVRVAALNILNRCGDTAVEMIAPLAEAEDKQVRAAAVSVLSRHSGEGCHAWFRAGLTDPEAHVRLTVARQLGDLEPSSSEDLFLLALSDSNPKIVEMAEKLTAGKALKSQIW